jgi:regulatory protein
VSDSSSTLPVRKKAMALLARREHSRVELKHKLQQRGFALDNIIPTLQKLESDGLQSDDRFAECYIRSRIQAGFGPCRIALELTQRGISKILIDKYLNRQDDEFWTNQTQLVWSKRFIQKASDPRAYAKQYRFLKQRGFQHENIIQILKGSERV